MSRLCRLKTASHGDDGKLAYDEIVSQRKQIEALAAQVGVLREAAQMAVEMIETVAYERRHVRWKLLDAIATTPESALSEVRKAERERVAQFILNTNLGNIPKEWLGFAADGLFKYAEAIRAMGDE